MPFKTIAAQKRLSMADANDSGQTRRAHSMSLLAHLQELRKRIIFSVLGIVVGFISCWSFADRIFGLMPQRIIGALHHRGIAGAFVLRTSDTGTVHFLEAALVGGLYAGSPFVFYQLWLFIAPGLYRK